MSLSVVMSGILNLGLPDDALPQLRAATRVLAALAVAFWTLAGVTSWRLALGAAVAASAGLASAWCNAVRSADGQQELDGQRHAVAHLVARMAGKPVPPSRGQRPAA